MLSFKIFKKSLFYIVLDYKTSIYMDEEPNKIFIGIMTGKKMRVRIDDQLYHFYNYVNSYILLEGITIKYSNSSLLKNHKIYNKDGTTWKYCIYCDFLSSSIKGNCSPEKLSGCINRLTSKKLEGVQNE